MKSITFQFYITIAVALAGCKKIEPPVTETNTDEQEVILRLMMPQNNKLSTYAIDSVDQNTIYTLDVLAFRIADDGKEIYAYRKRGVLLRPNPGATEVNFYANLLKSDDNYRFVLIANAATQLQEVLNKLAPNTLKETLMSSLTYTITNRWNNNSSTNFTPLPMWGESNIIHGINTNTQGFNVSMLRSLAAIDVSVSARNFIMTAVRVYNHPAKGRVAPLAANYDAVNRKVTKPSIPSDAGLLPKPDFYNTNSENAVKNEIFLFERDASATGESNATALLIKGKYNGSNTETYYRIDLTDDNGKPMPLLRNHRYSIDITTVHAPGFADETQAWNSRPVGMTASVTQWNEVTIADTNAPLQYLKVSSTKEGPNGLEGALTFSIWTNAPDVTLDLPRWLNILELNKVSDKITYKLKVDENPSTTGLRNGKINVKVGRLTRVINVVQGARPIDLGPDYNFYLFANDIGGAYWWYRAANVEINNESLLDASLTQKEGEPYPESCVARLGQGARLPTIQELQQLIPIDAGERAAVNNAIQAQQGAPLAISAINPYLSSSSASLATAHAIRTSNGMSVQYRKFTGQGEGNLLSRCVISK